MATFKITLIMFFFSIAALLSLAHSEPFDYHKHCQRTNVPSQCNEMIDEYPNQGAKTTPNGICAIVMDVTENGGKGLSAYIQGLLKKNPTARQKASLEICLDRCITIATVAGRVDCNVINKSTYPTINKLLGVALDAIEECINSWNTPPAIPNMFPKITTQQNGYVLVDLQLINLFVCNKPTVCS